MFDKSLFQIEVGIPNIITMGSRWSPHPHWANKCRSRATSYFSRMPAMTSTMRTSILNRITSICLQTNTSSRRCRPIRMHRWISSLLTTQQQHRMNCRPKLVSRTSKCSRKCTKTIRRNYFKGSSSSNTISSRNLCNNSGHWPMYICLKSMKSWVTVSIFEITHQEFEISMSCPVIYFVRLRGQVSSFCYPLSHFTNQTQFRDALLSVVYTIGSASREKYLSALKIRSSPGNFNVCAHYHAYWSNCVPFTWNSTKQSSIATFRMFFHLSHKPSLFVRLLFSRHWSSLILHLGSHSYHSHQCPVLVNSCDRTSLRSVEITARTIHASIQYHPLALHITESFVVDSSNDVFAIVTVSEHVERFAGDRLFRSTRTNQLVNRLWLASTDQDRAMLQEPLPMSNYADHPQLEHFHWRLARWSLAERGQSQRLQFPCSAISTEDELLLFAGAARIDFATRHIAWLLSSLAAVYWRVSLLSSRTENLLLSQSIDPSDRHRESRAAAATAELSREQDLSRFLPRRWHRRWYGQSIRWSQRATTHVQSLITITDGGFYFTEWHGRRFIFLHLRRFAAAEQWHILIDDSSFLYEVRWTSTRWVYFSKAILLRLRLHVFLITSRSFALFLSVVV